ncbi:MAG: PD-(D/E)XK nuclease family protein [Synergistaceae bacterium]|jgi:RecB family exonuclease|nr:PD-(D/E)XK nuclease family protein [Synergistaceae bacterium]
MNLTFGMFLDGAPWSDREAALGEARFGPAGTLGFLETRLGLTTPAVHPARRIDEYLGHMKFHDRPDRWWHKSFQIDPWSTARQMLAWRDQLVAGGWRGKGKPFDESDMSGVSPRLAALADLEGTSENGADKGTTFLSRGVDDRLQEVMACLEGIAPEEAAMPLPIETVHLLDRRELLPPAWQKIWTLAEKLGVTIVDAESHPHASAGALALVQAALLSHSGRNAVTPDDSLVFVEAEDEWEAAEALATWLAADETPDGTAREPNEDAAIICGANTDVLDRALARQGLPRLGFSGVSRWRASIQILPLVLANVWRPVDAQRLAELLSMPMSPIPRSASRRLLRALTEEPGVGGDAWKKALDSIVEDRVARMKERAEKAKKPFSPDAARKEAEGFAAELNAILSEDRYSPDTGVSEAALKLRCQWTIGRLTARTAEADSILMEAVGQAREMQALADGKGTLPRTLVDRMLDSVIGTGSPDVDCERVQQAAPWEVVSHPGQIAAPVGTVLWWGFVDPASPASDYWSPAEREVLKNAGVELEPPTAPRYREAEAWRRALRFARKRFIMFCPRRKDGQETSPHPLWDEISSVADSGFLRRCDALCAEGNWRLAGRSATLQRAEREESAPVVAAHKIPPARFAPPENLSYSQMSTLIGCPMKWAFQYHAGLRTSDILALPSGNRMIGNLCHRIIHEIYASAPRVDSDEAAAHAARLYDELLPSMASELLLEGRELDNKRTKRAVVYAVRQLAECVGRLGLTVERPEEKLESRTGDVAFSGYADLILRDRSGSAFVLDMKWTGSSRYRKEEVEEGRAMQLAAYAWLLRSLESEGEGSKSIHSGYFMLAQGELLSDSPLLGDDALLSPRTSEEIWRLSLETWNRGLCTLDEGVIEAEGVAERRLQLQEGLTREKLHRHMMEEKEAQGLMYVPPPCAFCDYAVLCGLNEVRS